MSLEFEENRSVTLEKMRGRTMEPGVVFRSVCIGLLDVGWNLFQQVLRQRYGYELIDLILEDGIVGLWREPRKLRTSCVLFVLVFY